MDEEQIDIEIVELESEVEPEAEGGEPDAADAEAVPLFDDAEPAAEPDAAAMQAELKRLRQQVKQAAPAPAGPAAPKPLGAKPKLADFDFDGDKYEVAVDEWYTAKAEVDRVAAQQLARQQEQQAEFDKMVQRYQTSRAALGAEDYDEVELAVQGELDLAQQGVLIQGSEHAAQLVYALGKSSKRLNALKAIKDPIKFAFAVARLEQELMAKGKSKQGGGKTGGAPAPEGKVRGGSGAVGSSANDRRLEQLRAEAAKTGDVSKVVAFKRKLKESKAG